MLEDRPVLKDRLTAGAVFAGIALGAVSGFELVITGGFDFLTPGREVREVAPSAYVIVERAPWQAEARYVRLSSTEPLFAGETVVNAAGDLAGGPYDETAPDGAYATAPNEADLYREIEALYAQEPAPISGGRVEHIAYTTDITSKH